MSESHNACDSAHIVFVLLMSANEMVPGPARWGCRLSHAWQVRTGKRSLTLFWGWITLSGNAGWTEALIARGRFWGSVELPRKYSVG